MLSKKPVPNIVYILADDMGYGDISRFNSSCGFTTPSLDRLCDEGMRFTDAHAVSAVCTPSRYSILTGRYCWRSSLKRDVLQGYDPPIIEPGCRTVADLLHQRNYRTACIGKWHLGLRFALKDPQDKYSVDFSKPLEWSPNDVGFDYFYGISSSLDMPPYVYIENHEIDGLPNRKTACWWDHGNSYNKGMFRPGPTGENFHHEQVLEVLTQKAENFIRESKDSPFFLYFPLTAPHTPILPTEEWKGKSNTTEYGDFVLMCDDVVRRIRSALEQTGAANNTIIIFASDNGCSPRANYPELAQYGHNPSGILRGTKFDIFEGGHRVPFIVHWPGHVPSGAVCDQTVCLMDLYATLAQLLQVPLNSNEAVDSISELPLWLGQSDYSMSQHREALIHHSVNGSFSVRMGVWKLILCPDSGGKSAPLPGDTPSHYPSMQLYQMDTDIRERFNQINMGEHASLVAHMCHFLEDAIEKGRTTPGPSCYNTPETLFEAQKYQ